MQRRDFLKTGAMAGVGLFVGGRLQTAESQDTPAPAARGPIVISTWNHGVAANMAAYSIMMVSGSAVEAAMRGVMLAEADPMVTSVGYGGAPNSEGVVQLDAAIMDGRNLEAGSVAALEGIMHPIAVARKVMDDTPHVMLVGEGAQRFALEKGFKKEDLLSPAAKKAFEKRQGKPKTGKDDHDTIGLVAMDRSGNLGAACTTSGLASKLPGRVGDSPLIGHGLYCDNDAGGAAATGLGEEVIKVCGSYQVVEFMRQGMEPGEAIERVLARIVKRDPRNKTRMVGFVALRKDGKVGYGCTTPGFQAAVKRGREDELIDVAPFVKSR